LFRARIVVHTVAGERAETIGDGKLMRYLEQ
jgi:hypothetical protein